MKRILATFMALAVIFSAFAQKDEEARKILEKVSSTTKSYNTIRIKFLYIMDNRIEKMKDTTKGTIYLKGDKFKLFFKGNEVFSDGKTVWTHMLDANEITITTIDSEDEESLNPANVLTIYEKGFKYRYMGEIKDGGKYYYQIDLYPEHPKDKAYSIVKLKIDKSTYHLSAVKMVGKEGIDYILEVLEFKPNVKVVDSMFTFDPSKYPKDIEINDMRDE